MVKTSEQQKTRIDPDEWYGLLDIVKLGLFPWCRGIRLVRQWIVRDKKGKNVLKATIVGKGRKSRYLIKGENIIKFVEKVEAGTYM